MMITIINEEIKINNTRLKYIYETVRDLLIFECEDGTLMQITEFDNETKQLIIEKYPDKFI